MKVPVFALTAVALLAAATATTAGEEAQSAAPPTRGERYALIIGIDGYRAMGALTTCRADAQGLAKVLLEKGGYREDRVALLVDGGDAEQPTQAAIMRRVEQFATLAEEGDTLLVFFSGHGVTREGRGYLVPVDGDQDHAVSLDRVKELLGASRASSKVLILDACHAGSAAKGVGGIAPSLVAAGGGLSMLLSCGEGEESYPDDAAGKSAFSLFLIEGLGGAADADADARVTETELYAHVKDRMKGWCVRTGKRQTPVLFGDASGAVVAALRGIDDLRAERERLQRELDAARQARSGGTADERRAEEEELARLKEKLARAKKAGDPAERAIALVGRIDELRSRRKTVSAEYPTGSPVLASLDGEIARAESEYESVAPEAVRVIRDRLAANEARYAALIVKYAPESPEMTALAREKTALQEQFQGSLALLSGAKLKALGLPPRVPAGFRLAQGATYEPYSDTGWAKEVVHEKTGVEMVFIPAGEFDMGSPASEKGRSEDETLHHVILTKPFYLGKYEVTQDEWRPVMDSNASNFNGRRNPVEQVSWDDCQVFLQKAGCNLRLPAEAEWEYGCRAGSRTPWSFGDSERRLPDYAWYDNNSDRTTHPVGQKSPNAWGVYDMHGNVWEWCSDWYGEYPTRTVADPSGPRSGSGRVLRGGSWGSSASYCRSAFRGGSSPGSRDFPLGFRLARTIQ